MKIAIFHDYFSFIGGGEKVVLTLARHLKADIITTHVDRSLISKMGFEDVSIISLGKPVSIPPLKQIHATFKFAFCNFSGKYDFYIFSGNWAHHASRHHRPNLMYCYTPVRVFYDMNGEFLASRSNPVTRIAAKMWINVHRFFYEKSISRVETIVSISDNVSARVTKYLGRDSTVIYPPCDTSRFGCSGDEGFWLSVNRIYPEKRIELQVEAFRKMPEERLVIIGNSGKGDHSAIYAKQIRGNLPDNVSLVSDITEDELAGYYSRCRGLITTAANEDFGMTAVEAMASGKPVIAVREGGYIESVIDGKTGVLIDSNAYALIRAIKSMPSDLSVFHDACVEQSRKFDVSNFLSRMDSIIMGDKVGNA